MLYPYRLALEKALPSQPVPGRPADLFLQLVYSVNETFSSRPFPLWEEGSPALLLLYRDVAYTWRDIADSFGDAVAAISARWPLFFYGTTGDRETAQLSIQREGERTVLRLHSVSGRPFEGMEGLCLRLETDSPAAAASLGKLSTQLSLQLPMAAVPRQYEGFLQGCSTLPTAGSAFLYLAWAEVDKPTLLGQLSPAQKKQLWRTFLADGVQPLEFDWLWDAYGAGQAPQLLEWEMALRIVLEELGFTVCRREDFFQVADSRGRLLRFDLVKGGPAEKIFLKLLFPLDSK